MRDPERCQTRASLDIDASGVVLLRLPGANDAGGMAVMAMVRQVAFHQLPVWVRLAAVLTLFNTWVLVAEFVIDRYGLDERLPFYRYGDVCLWDIAVIVALIVIFVRASRAPDRAEATAGAREVNR